MVASLKRSSASAHRGPRRKGSKVSQARRHEPHKINLQEMIMGLELPKGMEIPKEETIRRLFNELTEIINKHFGAIVDGKNGVYTFKMDKKRLMQKVKAVSKDVVEWGKNEEVFDRIFRAFELKKNSKGTLKKKSKGGTQVGGSDEHAQNRMCVYILIGIIVLWFLLRDSLAFILGRMASSPQWAFLFICLVLGFVVVCCAMQWMCYCGGEDNEEDVPEMYAEERAEQAARRRRARDDWISWAIRGMNLGGADNVVTEWLDDNDNGVRLEVTPGEIEGIERIVEIGDEGVERDGDDAGHPSPALSSPSEPSVGGGRGRRRKTRGKKNRRKTRGKKNRKKTRKKSKIRSKRK